VARFKIIVRESQCSPIVRHVMVLNKRWLEICSGLDCNLLHSYITCLKV